MVNGNFFTAYCHSPEGDAAAVLSDTAYNIYSATTPGDNARALAEFALSECSP